MSPLQLSAAVRNEAFAAGTPFERVKTVIERDQLFAPAVAHVLPEKIRELSLKTSLAILGFPELWMPVRVESNRSHVAVPTAARSLKHLVATDDRTTKHSRAVSCNGRLRLFTHGFDGMLHCQDDRPRESSRSTGPRKCLLRQPEIHAASSEHPAFRRRCLELRRTQRRSVKDAPQQSRRGHAGVEVVLVRLASVRFSNVTRSQRTQLAARRDAIASRRTPASVFATIKGARDAGGTSSSAVA